MHKQKIQSQPSDRLNTKQVQAYFILKHTSIRQWAMKNGFNPSTVNMALRGERHGALSKEIIRKLNQEIGA